MEVAAPTISVSGNKVICAFSTSTLLATGTGTAYTWSNAQTGAIALVSASVTTSYTTTATDVNGCQASVVTEVTVNPAPSVSVTGNTTLCAGASATLSVAGASTYTWSTGSNNSSLVVAPTQNTTYSVTGSDAIGCSRTAFVNMAVNAIPSITVGGSPGVCIGSSATLSAAGAGTYLWSNGSANSSIVITPTANISYSVTGTSANGCSSTAVKAITVNSLPVITVVPSSTVCSGASLTLNQPTCSSAARTGPSPPPPPTSSAAAAAIPWHRRSASTTAARAGGK